MSKVKKQIKALEKMSERVLMDNPDVKDKDFEAIDNAIKSLKKLSKKVNSYEEKIESLKDEIKQMQKTEKEPLSEYDSGLEGDEDYFNNLEEEEDLEDEEELDDDYER